MKFNMKRRVFSAVLMIAILFSSTTPSYAIGGDYLTAFFQSIESFRNFFSTSAKWAENLSTMKAQFLQYKKMYENSKKVLDKLEKVSTGIVAMKEIKETFDLSERFYDKFYENYEIVLTNDYYTYEQKVAIDRHMKSIVSVALGEVATLKDVVSSKTKFSFTDHERWEIVRKVNRSLRNLLLYFDDFTNQIMKKSKTVKTKLWAKDRRHKFAGSFLGI